MGPLAMSDSSFVARRRISSSAMIPLLVVGEAAVAVRGDHVQRGHLQGRATLFGHGKDRRRLPPPAHHPGTAVAVVDTGPGPEINRVGVTLGEACKGRQD